MHNNYQEKINKERLSIGESAEYLGVSIDTLRRWEKKKVILALRSPGGHRYFLKKDLDKLFGQKYARVSAKKEVQIKQEEKQAESTIEINAEGEIEAAKQRESLISEKTILPEEPRVSAPKPSNVLIPPTVIQQQLTQNSPNNQPVQIQKISQPKKEISWTAIIIIGLILFTVIDVVLLIFYLTSSQPLASPVP